MEYLIVIGKRLLIFALKLLPIYIILTLINNWLNQVGDGYGMPQDTLLFTTLLTYFAGKLALFLLNKDLNRSHESIRNEADNLRRQSNALRKSASKRHSASDAKEDRRIAEDLERRARKLEERLEQ